MDNHTSYPTTIICNKCGAEYTDPNGCYNCNPWKLCRKKPIEVQFREPNAGIETIKTREGTLNAFYGHDYIIMGVNGEVYPIEKEIFEKTYDVPPYRGSPTTTREENA